MKQTSENLLWLNCLLFIFRTILSAIHFNYDRRRENKVDDQGNIKVKVTYPKFKDGKVTVREIKVEQNYGTYKNTLMFLSTVNSLSFTCIYTCLLCTACMTDSMFKGNISQP